MSGLKVALISHEFPPFTLGGIGTHCHSLAYSLSAKGIETKVICGTTTGSGGKTKVNNFLEIVRLPCPSFPPKYFWFQLLNAKVMTSLVSDCDVIHGVNPTASFGIALTHEFSDRALVTTHHSNSLQMLKMFTQMPPSEFTLGDFSENFLSYPLDDFLERLWFKRADRIVVPGTSTFEFMTRTYPRSITEKVSIVYNGINFERIDELTRDHPNVGSEMSVVCFCRLISLKGVAQFLRGSKSLFSEFPAVHLKIFGSGPLYPKLKRIIQKNGLTKNVTLMGYVPNTELIRQVNLATVVVLPTFLEVGPFISALEAMACRKAPVLFNFSFNREFVTHMETGVMAKPGDIIDLVSKIKLLLSNDDLRMKLGENAYQYVRENHNWTTLASKYVEIYKEALSGKGGSHESRQRL